MNDPASLPDLPAVEEFRTHIDLGNNLPKARVAAISFDKLDLETGMEVADPTGKIDATVSSLEHPGVATGRKEGTGDPKWRQGHGGARYRARGERDVGLAGCAECGRCRDADSA